MREAVALKKWLVEQNPPLANEIFLDIDPDSGLKAGTRWKDALRQANARCEAVICLLSANWEASHECKVEYRTAENLNKQIFVARLEPSTGDDLTSEWQRSDMFGSGAMTSIALDSGAPVQFSTAGLYRLRDGILGAGIGAEAFVWPPPGDPDRAPYRGWAPLEEADAAVFFGRDSEILRALDVLRGMRRSEVNSLFVVLGPSGTGKSSFLRAGLLPRLRREDRRFVVCDIVRPERNALIGESGLAQAIVGTRRAFGMSVPSLGDVKAACLSADADRIAGWLDDVRDQAAKLLLDRDDEEAAGDSTDAPTLVLPLDQAEELFSADAGENAETFLTLLAAVARRCNQGGVGFLVAATIRTDRYEVMQTHPALAGMAAVLFDELKPMPPTQFKEVIVGPAERASESAVPLRVSPDLVDRLLADAGHGADTLPMLALTLSRLYTDYGSTGELTVAQYETLGGMRRVVQTEIDEVLSGDPERRAGELAALRAAFIPWLATVNPDNDQPMRRVARFADLPPESRPLVDALVSKRLMVKDIRDGQTVVEVALESLLRQWDELAGWLREERKRLKDADDVERAAGSWAANDGDPAWLLSGTRLAEAEALSAAPGFQQRLTGSADYLSASRQAEDHRLGEIEERRQAEIRNAQERQATAEAHATTLRKRSRVLRAMVALTGVVALVAVLAGVSFFRASGQAQSRFEEATAQRLVTEATAMLDGSRPGGDAQAFQQLLAARRIASSPDDAAIYNAATKTVDTVKIINTPDFVNGIAVSPDGAEVASAGRDGAIRIWELSTGRPVGEPLTGHDGAVWSVAFSPDGKMLASAGDDHTVRRWDTASHQQIGDPMTGHDDVVRSVAFSPDGAMLVSGSFDRTARLWDARRGTPVGNPLRGHHGWVFAVAFSPDGRRVATGGYDHTVGVWDVATGTPVAPLREVDTGPVNAVAYSPNGRLLLSGSQFGDLMIWNPDTGLPVGPSANVTSNVIGLGFSRDGKTLAIGSADNMVLLFDPAQPDADPVRLSGHESAVFGVVFTPDGQIVSGSRDTTVRVWNGTRRQPMYQDQQAMQLAFGPDGKNVASAGLGSDPLSVWNLENRTEQPVPGVESEKVVMSVGYSRSGDRLVAGLIDGRTLMWDTATMKTVGPPLTPPGIDPAFAVAFSPDGSKVAVLQSNALDSTAEGAARHGLVTFHDARTGAPLPGELHLGGAAASLVYTPDGSKLVVAGTNGYLQMWDIASTAPTGEPFDFPHDVGIASIDVSPDGKLVVTGAADSGIRFWDTASGEPAGPNLIGHSGGVNAVRFSPDGKLLASTGMDKTVRLWDVGTRQPYGQPLTGHDEAVSALAFSPDGKTLVSGSRDRTLRTWPAAADPAELCDKLAQNMSHAQWNTWVSPEIDYVSACPDLPVARD